MNDVAIEVVDVSKRYGPLHALRAVRFSVAAGHIHGLLGPNGAGKTTMMRVLLGLVRIDEGSVRILGKPLGRVGEPPPDGVAGFVDAAAFYPYLTGRKNLELVARLDSAHMRSRVAENDVLQRVGLDHATADRPVSSYSAGMRQRLGVAAALLRTPKVLLLDEATGSLDPAAARDLRELARGLAADGTAVVWSSHDMTEVEQLCNALTVIDRGRVVFSGTVGNLRQRATASTHTIATRNNRSAAALAVDFGLTVSAVADALELVADDDTLDRYVIALGRAGIAVRALSRQTRSLETLFLELTGDREHSALDVRRSAAEERPTELAAP